MKEFNTKDFKEFIEELFNIKLTSCQEIILDMLCKNNTEESVSWNEIFNRNKCAERIPVRLGLKELPVSIVSFGTQEL